MDAGKLIGRGISFPPRVGPDGRVQWSEGERNVREAIQVILATEPRERILLPEFGAGLSRFLFEPNTVTTRSQIAERITRALGLWEPRTDSRLRLTNPETVRNDGKDRILLGQVPVAR